MMLLDHWKMIFTVFFPQMRMCFDGEMETNIKLLQYIALIKCFIDNCD